jgi:hypothetical protein
MPPSEPAMRAIPARKIRRSVFGRDFVVLFFVFSVFTTCEHLRASGLPLYPRGPRSGPGYVVPVHLHLIGPIRPAHGHILISPPCGLYLMPSLCVSA